MQYTALYRKFRPIRFDEMVGQDHITRTLKNQVIENRVGHAYLFNGGRGTGKTSAAKILARAVNCLNPQNGEPCNECEMCKAMLNGTLTDVVEMDAASNSSVEDIRQIVENVNFLPTQAKYRVYIIDEVHMLSNSAFNALLKTLEEPPEHVKFILATTDPQKMPATILSRCQRFDFKKISDEDIIKRLKIVCEKSNISITEDALKLIAVLAEGGMRDSLSILERCIQDGDNQITEEKIKDLVGIPKIEYVNKIVNAIINKQPENAVIAMQEVIDEGKELENFLVEIIKYLRDILVYKTTKKLDIYSKEEIKQIEELSLKVSNEKLIKLIANLSDLSNQMKWSMQKKIVFEAGILKNCIETETDGLEERVKKLENEVKAINSGVIKPNVQKPEVKQVSSVTSITSNVSKSKEKVKTENVKNVISKSEMPGEYAKYWPNVLNSLKSKGKVVLFTNLINTQAKETGDILQIEFPKGMTIFGKTVLTKAENIADITNIVEQISGKKLKIKYIDMQNASNIESNTDMPFNIIDK